MVIGYARVSTHEQNLALQIQALQRAGCDKIYTDQGQSGSLRSRPGLNRALAALKPDDKLTVWRLDRLGRSLMHLVQLLDRLGQRGVRFESLNERIDTSSSGGRLVFHMMAALAEFERALISERTRAGMAAATANGKTMGRKPLLTFSQCREALGLIERRELGHAEAAARYGVHARTLQRGLDRFMALRQSDAPG